MPSSPQEVYLSDERVLPIQDLLYQDNPAFIGWHTDLVTVRHEPPYTGVLPEGPMGRSEKAVLQFLLVSDYPETRKIQRAAGVRHATLATLYEDAWEEAEQERKNGHYVNGNAKDPLEIIFRGLAKKHKWEVNRLASIMN